MKKVLKITAAGLLLTILLSAAGVYAYLQSPEFGAQPDGERLEKIVLSPNYRDGEFRNLDPTPEHKGNILSGWTRMLLTKKVRPRPDFPVPSVKMDLKTLDRHSDLILWLGHASCYIQLGGKRFLIDPVFNDHAAPFSFANRAFDGAGIYSPEEMPDIDYLLITHDHWDHLDYPTIMGLMNKADSVIVPLGVGAHFERWGFSREKVREMDWGDALQLEGGTVIHALPSLHYSGRLLTRNKTLWAAYALVSPERKIYLGGDSGYGSHFKAAGEAFGGFDFAVLDSGQYNENWRWVHMMPEDTALAANDLNAGAVLPVHTGKFAMAYHAWDDPFIRMAEAGRGQPFALVMPVPGESVSLEDPREYISGWWDRANPGQRSLARTGKNPVRFKSDDRAK